MYRFKTRCVFGLVLFALFSSHALASDSNGVCARLIIEKDKIAASGLALSSFDLSKLIFIPGPQPNSHAVKLRDANQPLTISTLLDKPLGTTGSLLFWFKTDKPYHSGKSAVDFRQPLIDANGMFVTRFWSESTSVQMFLEWADRKQDRDMQVQIPAVPGPEWIHLAYCWDAPNKMFNCYVNGTPYRVVGSKLLSLDVNSTDNLLVHLGRFAIADVIVMDRPFEPNFLEHIVGAHQGKLDRMLGGVDLGKINLECRKGELVYSNDLSSPKCIADWTIEGPAYTDVNNGWLTLHPKEPNGPSSLTGHYNIWCDRQLPASFVATWDIQILSPYHFGIVYFCAKGVNGEDIFAPSLKKRDGMFHYYINGDINSYHISYFALAPYNAGRATSNLRKNSGFFLASNGPIGIDSLSHDVHKAVLMKDGPHIIFTVDGRVIIEFFDDGRTYGPVLGEGRFGWRHMRWTTARYRDLKVYTIK